MYKLQLFIRILIAATLISGLFYLRLLPRTSRDLWENMNYQQLSLTLLSIFLIGLSIYNLLKTLGYIKPKSAAFAEYIKNKFSHVLQFFVECLEVFYGAVWYILEYVSGKYFNKKYLHYDIFRITLKHANKEKYFKYYVAILLAMSQLPKVLFLIAFAVDVLIYHHLNYTFSCIPLLLVPLLERFIIFIFCDYYDSHHADTNSLVEQTYIPERNIYHYSYKPEYAENPPKYVRDFDDYFDNHFLVMFNLKKSLERYENFKTNLNTDLLALLLISFRLLLYIYILYYGLI